MLRRLNKTGPSTDHWGTPLVTGLQQPQTEGRPLVPFTAGRGASSPSLSSSLSHTTGCITPNLAVQRSWGGLVCSPSEALVLPPCQPMGITSVPLWWVLGVSTSPALSPCRESQFPPAHCQYIFHTPLQGQCCGAVLL